MIDEVVGMLVTLAVPPTDVDRRVVGFVVFRAVDVVKPFPAATGSSGCPAARA